MRGGTNRRTTGVGVRPRGNRIEITADFTPDPGLMVATATLIVGIVREVMSWSTYDLSILQKLPIPVIAGVVPGKHTTRKGWLTKDFHYPQSPYTSDIDAPVWRTQLGEIRSVRRIGRDAAGHFRRDIRKYSDPFSFRLLFAILDGRAPSMLELIDRPAAYEDVGRLCKWGMVTHELKNYETELDLLQAKRQIWPPANSVDEYVVERHQARAKYLGEMTTVNAASSFERMLAPFDPIGLKDAAPGDPVTPPPPVAPPARRRPLSGRSRTLSRRHTDTPGKLMPPRASSHLDRRGTCLLPPPVGRPARRNAAERRPGTYTLPFPDRRLTRSAYEQVFLKLVSGGHLRLDGQVYTPVGMKGWYHALFRRESDGAEKLMSIDELLGMMEEWV